MATNLLIYAALQVRRKDRLRAFLEPMSDQSPVSAKLAISPMLGVEKRTISVIAVIAMLRMLGLFALLPVLSLYAAGLEGATPVLIGLAVGAYGLTQAGLQIPLGALSDRVGRVPVIVAGLAVFAIGSLVAMYSDTIHGVIAGRLLQGAGAISATLTALIADATRAEVRTRSMAFVGIGIGASFLIAMVLGPLLAASFGVRALFGLGVLVAFIAALLLLLLPKGIQKPRTREGRWDFRLALRADLLRLDFYIFSLHAILTASFVALPFLLSKSLELPVTSHWKLYVGALLLSLIGTIPLIVRDERQGKGGTIGVAVLLILIVLVAFIAALLLLLLPKGIQKPRTREGRWDFRLALRADLLRLDFYIFSLHAILTASFVALPFLLSKSLELPVTSHWKLYVGALLLSLIGTIPLIVRDERQGKGGTIGVAVLLILIGELLLTFAAFSPASVFLALALFFAGFNFLEAGLPARLSLLASEESRGASLGVFSSSQFLGAFVGGLIGGRFLSGGDPADVFRVCVMLASIWLALLALTRKKGSDPI